MSRSPGELLRSARLEASLSQKDLALLAGTSPATIAAYETGRKEPRLSTLVRLVEATGAELAVEVRPRLSANERRSLELHREIAAKLRRHPERVRACARRNLARARSDPRRTDEPYLDTWERLLALDPERLAEFLVSTSRVARDLRPTSPFAGVLTDRERTRALDRSQ